MTRALGAVALVLVLGVTGWFVRGWIWPDEQARVKEAVAALATTITEAGNAGGGLGLVEAVGALRDQVTEDVTIESEERGVRIGGRDQVVALVARVAASPNRLALAFVDVAVELDDAGTTATVQATTQMTETSTATGQQGFDAQQVDMTWVKQGQSWLLQSARAIEVLR